MCSIPSFCHLFGYFYSASIYIGHIIETQHNYSARYHHCSWMHFYCHYIKVHLHQQDLRNPGRTRNISDHKGQRKNRASVGSWRALNSGWRQVIPQSTKWDFLHNRFGRTLLASSTVTRTTSPSCSDSCKNEKKKKINGEKLRTGRS